MRSSRQAASNSRSPRGTSSAATSPAEPGSDVTFDRVALAGKGAKSLVGTPVVEGAKVTGTVLRQGKGRKILVFKYKPKKRVRKLTGHRQRFSEVKITKIDLP